MSIGATTNWGGGCLGVLSTPKYSVPVSNNIGNSKTSDFINNN